MVISTRTRPDRKDAPAALTARDHLNTFFYYRKVAAWVFLAVAALGIFLSVVFPIPYRAQATLLVLFAGYYDQSNDVRGSAMMPAIGQLVSVEAQILHSPELHRQVVMSELGPNASSRKFDRTLQDFESRLHIEQNDLANTVTLSYYDTDPKRAAHVLSILLTQYFRQRATIFTSGRAAMLSGQRDEVRAKLDKADADLMAFQKAHGIVNIDDQIVHAVTLENLLIQRKMENAASLVQDQGALIALKAATRGVQPDIVLYSDNGEMVHALATMQISLVELESRRSELASRYMASSPFVQQLDKQIADLRQNIARQKQQLSKVTRYGHNSYYDTVQDRLTSLETSIAGEISRQKELTGQIAEAHARSQGLIAVADQVHQMQTDRDILADSYRERARQVELADIQQAQASKANSTNVRVIQAPLPPTRRSVSVSLLMAASVAVALAISALVVLVLASLRETFLSPEQAERSLVLPVLSAPIIMRRIAARRRSTVPAAKQQAGKPEGGGAISPVRRRPRGMLSVRLAHTAYGRMASAIHGSSDTPSKVVMMLAPGKDEGVHRVIQGAAVELARRSTKPVLIFDMNSSSDASVYGQANEQGMIDWPNVERIGDARVADRNKSVAEVDLHPVVGQNIVIARPKSGALMSMWQRADSLFRDLSQDHQYVLIHGPSSTRSFDGIEHAAAVDAVVLVVRAESTRKPVALGLKEQVLDAGGKIIGIAMTYRQVYIPKFFYRFFLSR